MILTGRLPLLLDRLSLLFGLLYRDQRHLGAPECLVPVVGSWRVAVHPHIWSSTFDFSTIIRGTSIPASSLQADGFRELALLRASPGVF